MTAVHIIEKIREAYAKVAEWPEERMSAGAVEDLGPGFLDLLALRNLVPALLSRAEAAEAEIDALRKALERLREATPESTNSGNAHVAFGFVRTIVDTVLDDYPARTLAGDNHE